MDTVNEQSIRIGYLNSKKIKINSIMNITCANNIECSNKALQYIISIDKLTLCPLRCWFRPSVSSSTPTL